MTARRHLKVGCSELHPELAIYQYDDESQAQAVPGLPVAARRLTGDVEAWQAYRERHWTPKQGWDVETRWWYAKEARRLERELGRALGADYDVVVSPWPAITELTLMNEYGCTWPIWELGGATSPGDDAFVTLTPQLRAELLAWASFFLDNYDYLRGWMSSYAEFHEEGRRLRAELQRQLGPTYEVSLSEWTQ